MKLSKEAKRALNTRYGKFARVDMFHEARIFNHFGHKRLAWAMFAYGIQCCIWGE